VFKSPSYFFSEGNEVGPRRLDESMLFEGMNVFALSLFCARASSMALSVSSGRRIAVRKPHSQGYNRVQVRFSLSSINKLWRQGILLLAHPTRWRAKPFMT